jgi:GntR family transcriptional regulator
MLTDEPQPGGRSQSAYRLVANHLRDGIADGRYPSGAKLPTEFDIAIKFGVSRHTVRRALDILANESLIRRVPGSGTYSTPELSSGRQISFGSLDDLLAMRADVEIIRPLETVIDPVSATRLNLDDDRVATLTLRRSAQEHTILISQVALPPKLGAVLHEIPAFTTEGGRPGRTVMHYIEEANVGVFAACIDQSITAVEIPATEAEWLGCAPGTATLKSDQTILAKDGEAIELTVTYYHPRHYSYRARLKRTYG